jgi:tetratricopeptide (TPR) repeat protein
MSLATFLLLLALASGTSAQDDKTQDDKDQRARVHFQSGQSYFETGRYERAVQEFLSAYELSPRPSLLYNIYLAYERFGDLPHAVEYLERYLEDSEKVPDRSKMETRLENLRKRLERQRKKEKKKEQQSQQPDTQQPQQRRQPEPQPDPKPRMRAPTNPPASGGGLSAPALAGFVAGGVGLAMWGGLGTAVLIKDGDFEKGCLDAGTCSKDALDRQDNLAIMADVGLGLAVVGAGLGLTFWLLDRGDEQAASPDVAAAPWIGPDGAGATAHVRF